MSEDPDDDPFADMDAPEDDSDPFEDLAGSTEDDTDEQPQPDAEESVFDDEGVTDPGPSDADRRLDEDPFSSDPTVDRTTADDGWGAADASDQAAGKETDTERSDATGAGTDVWDDEQAAGSGAGTADGDLFTEMDSSRRRQSEGDEDDPFEAFESSDVDEVDPDDIWERLSQAEDDEHVSFDEKVYYEVSKHRFCERCEYFSGPPETACTFEGADIVEFLDMETVRLVNCPVVAEQRELGNE